jgi:hypothetical protein
VKINKYLHQAKELQKRLNERSRNVPSILNVYIEALEQGGLVAARILIMNKIHPYGFIKTFLFYHCIARSTEKEIGSLSWCIIKPWRILQRILQKGEIRQ